MAAARAAGYPLKGINLWTAPQPSINADRTALHPEIAAAISEGPVLSALGGAVHNMIGLVRHPIPFDVILPDDENIPIDEDAVLIPYRILRAAVAHHLQEYLDMIGLVQAAAQGRVFHILAPPPPRDEERLAADVRWSYFEGLTREISPAPLRLKLWKIAAALTIAYCSKRGIGIVPPPPSCADEHGYLLSHHYADAMHANQEYGALVLDQVSSL